ncbi:Phosphotriesterase-related protein [Pseudolycoriella hygida]|uniref:Phosphotriesterase-related protein n=1 Tax=Pseudolycoriella hygida TaxID=35572 RepID=A0A9Q0NCM7_9DIPT|nr:Phosphotriesterase-related protein [Pseudolycoriella hygida]
MQVQTVLGPINPSQLGKTLTHEHLSLDFDFFYKEPPKQLNDLFTNEISLANLGAIRQYPYGSRYNINFGDADTHRNVIEDVLLYKKYGGGTIVENSSHGLKRNLRFLYDVSIGTGVHLIAGTGHYVYNLQSESHLAMSVENMVKLYIDEIKNGVDLNGDGKTFVKCGFIGEVGSVYPIHEFERRAIEATAIAQQELGCAVSFHPGRDSEAPFEIIRLYLEAGGKPEKCVMSHLDRTIFDFDKLLEFAAFGVYCQFDLFGTECSHYQLNPTSYMPSDYQRIENIIKLSKEGFTNRLLMSHDIHTKHRLVGFGGHGYAHIINNVLHRLITYGLNVEQVDQISVVNPADWLSFSLN